MHRTGADVSTFFGSFIWQPNTDRLPYMHGENICILTETKGARSHLVRLCGLIPTVWT